MLRGISSHRDRSLYCSGSGGRVATAQSYSRGPLAPSPAERRCHASGGALRARVSARGAAVHGGHGLTTRHRDDVADTPVLKPGAELVVLAVGLIRGHPPGRHTGDEGPFQHPTAEHRLGGEGNRVRHGRFPAPDAVCRPGPGQVELPIDQGTACRCGISKEHPELTVLHPAGGAGVLPLHTGGLAALLQKPGLVHHQDPSRSPSCSTT